MTRIITLALALTLPACSSSQTTPESPPPPAAVIAPSQPTPTAQPEPAPAAAPRRAGGRRLILPADGSKPRAAGTRRGQTLLAVDADFTLDGFAFPRTIGVYERGKIVDYGNFSRGYSVNYGSAKGLFATIYIYGDGQNDRREMVQVLQAIRIHYPNASLKTLDTISLSMRGKDVPAQYARVTFDYDGHTLLSDALVVSVNDSFLKMRITGTEAEWQGNEDIIRNLLGGMGLDTSGWI